MRISEMVTLFESFRNKYKYDVISIAISDVENNQDYSHKIQDLCFDNEIWWIHDDNKRFYVDFNYFGTYCLDINLKEKRIYLNPSSDGLQNIPYWVEGGLTVDPKIYKEDEYDLIKTIIVRGSGIPSYEPKKFLREGYDTLPFTEAVFKVDNKEEEKIVTDFLFANGYSHFGTFKLGIMYYPSYIFVHFEDKNITYLANEDDVSVVDYIMEYNRGVDNENINPNIFNCNDIMQLDIIIRTGKVKVTPNYNPRRIERTLESRNSLEEATEVCILINSEDDLNKLKEEESKIDVDYTWPHTTFTDFPLYLFFNLVNRDITHLHRVDMVRYLGPEIDMTRSGHFNGVYIKPYKMKNLVQFIQVLKDRKITAPLDVPSYEPRKIERTLESSLLESIDEGYLPFRVWCDNREKSLEFEDWLISHGWRWDYSTPDARLIREDNDAITNTFCNFDKENKRFDAYGSKKSEGYILFEYPQDLNQIRSYIIPKPTYSPRKIERTLERMNSLDEAHEVWMTINNRDELNRLKQAVTSIGEYGWPTLADVQDTFPFYLFADLESRSMTIANHSDMIRYTGVNLDITSCYIFDGIYEVPYTMSNLKQFIKVLTDKKITPIKNEVPSYAPRKIDRTLESVEPNYKYEVIIFEAKNRDESSKIQSDLIKNGYRWNGNIHIKNFDGYEFPVYLFAKIEGIITYMSGPELRNYHNSISYYIDEIIERGRNACKTIFSFKESSNVKDLMKWGRKGPSYEPKKIERTLESFNIVDYQYGSVVFKVNCKYDLIKIVTFFYNEYEIENNSNLDDIIREIDDSFAGDYELKYLVIAFGSNEFFLLTIEDFSDIVIKDKGKDNINPEIFSVSDLGSFGLKPIYKPKKIERTLESFKVKDYPYDSVAFKVGDKFDITRIITFFYNEHGIENFNSLSLIIKEIDTVFRGDYSVKCLVVSFRTKDFFLLKPENFSQFNTNPEIFSVNDLGMFGLRPDYNPRKIQRTLESVKNDVSELYIWAHIRKDCLELEDFMHKLGFVYCSLMGERLENLLVKHRGISEVTFYGFDLKNKTFKAYGSLQNEGSIRLDYPEDKSEIKNLLAPSPSYAPKKITRTLETYTLIKEGYIVEGKESDDEFSIEVDTDANSKMVQNYLFSQGYKWNNGNFIRPMEEGNIITCYKSDKQIVWIDNKSEYDRFLRTGWRHNPKIYTMKDWGVFSRLVSDRPYQPSYEPKKIERTLESVNSRVDIKSSMYFKEYNTLVFSLKEDDNTDDVISFVTKLDNIAETGFGAGMVRNIAIDSKVEPQYIRITLQDDDFEMGYSRLSSFPKFAERDNYTYKKIFSFTDISNYLDMILKTCDIVPSYEPRKIVRTLEAMKHYPYRFKTEQEFIEEFGVNWRDVMKNPMWNDSGDMDNLFGTEFPFEEHELNSKDSTRALDRRWEDPDSGYDWAIGWNMLTPNKPNKPSYAPKKIERTLESTVWYPYRFKTEKEMISNFGQNWRDTAFYGVGWNPGMNHLLGKDFPYFQYQLQDNKNLVEADERLPIGGERYHGWLICWDMLTPNKPNKPSYEPRKIKRTLESKMNKTHADILIDKLSKGKYTCINIGYRNMLEARAIRKYLEDLGFIHNLTRVSYSYSNNDLQCVTIFTIENESFDSFYVYGSGNGEHMEDGTFSDSHPMYTVSPIFNLDQLKRYIDSYGTPNYEPKRIERTLENFHEKYNYDSIVVAIRSMNEMDEIRNYLGNFENYDAIYQDFNSKGFENGGYYIRINERRFSGGHYLTYSTLSYLEPVSQNKKSYERLLTINDLRRGVLDNIFKFGVSIITPDYRPRRFDKTFESFINKYKYDGLIIKVDNAEESQKIQELFFKNGIAWGSGHLTPMYLNEDFPDYIMATLGYYFHRPQILHGSIPENGEWNDLNMDWNIYTINDYDTIKSILENGKPIVKPNYEPRKIRRDI